jgi:putative glutamine amidotransferase
MPLVAVTSIPRQVETTLGVRMPNLTVHERFAALVVAAGGTPAFVGPPADAGEIAASFDAIVLNGGTDVDPRRYGADPSPATDPPDEPRDSFELDLLAAAVELGKPVLGVCRGMQLINVGRGGTLRQDLGADLVPRHNAKRDFDARVHPIEIEPGSVLEGILGPGLRVNSVHHQAVDRLGDGLVASARSASDVVEAIEDPARRLLGVQWHPEFLDTVEHPEQLELFRALLAWADGASPVCAAGHSKPSV